MPDQALPSRQRVASYAVIRRAEEILLSRLAPYLSGTERWSLPGGGIDFGEHPRDAVVREVYEETGLEVSVGERAWVDSFVLRDAAHGETRHSVRMVYDGWVALDSPDPHVVEEDGSTVDAAWHRIADVESGRVPTVRLVREALDHLQPFRRQRPAAYALLRRHRAAGDEVLLTRISSRGFSSGSWSLPGGGIDHGESPESALVREVHEETGLDVEVGALLGVHHLHFSGTAPSGRLEDFHGIHLVFAATAPDDALPRVVELDGTTDAAEWIRLADIERGEVPVLEVVSFALAPG
ncbi:MAG: NUDIX domain-containing protein [Actinomycetota bacterium]|nr:NUDIX domain-containing protein [Actinomycetota bacterium]